MGQDLTAPVELRVPTVCCVITVFAVTAIGGLLAYHILKRKVAPSVVTVISLFRSVRYTADPTWARLPLSLMSGDHRNSGLRFDDAGLRLCFGTEG